jgi:hypothetical protein
MLEALCRQSSTTLDIMHAEDGPPITQRTSGLGARAILKPETVIRWHRAGFRSYWRWKSRHRGGRPTVPLEIRVIDRRRRARHGKTHMLNG